VPLLQPMVAAFGLVCAIVRLGQGRAKLVLFGATGMVGQGVMRECLLDPDVESGLAVALLRPKA
jgi:hypothetical protein